MDVNTMNNPQIEVAHSEMEIAEIGEGGTDTFESGLVDMTDPVDLSVGGLKGHLFRRFIHLAMVVLPLGYYLYGYEITYSLSDFLSMNITREQVVSVIILIVLIAEALRLKFAITIFGQREYEASQVSALAWGAFGISMCFIIAPEVGKFGAAYGIPLIYCLVLGDPAIGEVRRIGGSAKTAFTVGVGVCFAVWLGSWYLLDTPLWLAPLMAPLCTAAEWPRLKYIDDNATMLLIPLAAILILHPFTGL
jgi:hypothetical protein